MKNTETLVKRLIYQSWHRGCKETDQLLGNFAKEKLCDFSDDELKLYEEFINEDDWEIYSWLVESKSMPEKYINSIGQKVIDFNNQANIEKSGK